ncbi:hypothetical protein [Paractinoplanes durhamensis]|uniref:GAF domain-containing protein n=1 Tax=Paractinoplanes durhamensis TaxID=113563 RepID=A0ABQ3Z5R4_9ACTN|nr:hypothetical protein [Actinoplanes durhamensis]GIE05173.1 hypothetical protein Adu01nite_65230 [Actinoplanes durhamensis]
MTFRFFTPPAGSPADPVLAALSVAPDLLTATLALLRETTGPRPLALDFTGRIAAALLTLEPLPGRFFHRGPAYSTLRDIAYRGGELLSGTGRDTVTGTVGWEGGRRPDRPGEWATELVQDLPPADRVGTRIALLAAFAPAAIGHGDVGLWRLFHPADADLVRLVAYGAITATDHAARALAPAHR